MRNPKQYRQIHYTIRTLQVMCAVIAFLSFFVILGSVGAYDHAAIGFGTLITRLAIGITFAVGSVLGFHYFGGLTENDN